MMRIYLASAGVPRRISAIQEFEALAGKSKSHRHVLVDSAHEADICLFTECHQLGDPFTLRAVRQTDTFRHHHAKCFVFDQRPRAYCSLPGLFTSTPRRALHPTFQIPWGYHRITTPQSILAGAPPAEPAPDLLFSFVGSGNSHPSRPPLLELTHPRGLTRQVEGHVNWEPAADHFVERREDFAAVLMRSSFVLCPRGRATSSFRFYEVMAAGRVPVVIADDWLPPVGLNLSEFAIVWPEGTTAGLIEHLEERESEAAAMGRRAREVFDERFAEDVMFDNVGDALAGLAATLPWDRFPRWGFPPDRRVARHVMGKAKKELAKHRPR